MSEAGPPPFLDRRALARAFDRSGAHYDGAALLQQRVRTELLERLQYFALEPQWILDLGAGTCRACAPLQRRFAQARIVALDIAAGMLAATPLPPWPRRRWLRTCADAYALPLPAQCVELVFSSLMLQWCDRPDMVFREVARVLKPGGLFVFSTLGPDTLHELRTAWAAVDAGVHVSEFVDMPQLGEALMQSGLVEPVMDVDHQRLYYPDVEALMRALKRIGAANAARARARGLTGRTRMQGMIRAYEQHRLTDGLPASYEVIFGAAFGGPPSAGSVASPGEYVVPVSAVRRGGR